MDSLGTISFTKKIIITNEFPNIDASGVAFRRSGGACKPVCILLRYRICFLLAQNIVVRNKCEKVKIQNADSLFDVSDTSLRKWISISKA